MTNIRDIMGLSPIIPVAVIPPEVNEIKLAQALVTGGIPVIEVTLRTAGAIEKIGSISKSVETICVGAGTVWNAVDAKAVIDAGAQFIVSPAYVEEVHLVCSERNTPYLPGVQTVTEAARCVEHDLSALKLFPANLAGGPAIIKAMSSVLAETVFCPTGGVNGETAHGYLSLPNVPCVGGSWVLDKKSIGNEDWIKVQSDVESALQKLSAG